MPATVVNPQCGFARNQSEAEYPRLWNALTGLWSPAINSRGGTILRDWSAKQNHGTLTNMEPATDWVNSGGYSALDFDGTNESINCGQPSSTAYTGSLTTSCWFRLDTTPPTGGTSYILVGKDKDSGGRGFDLDIYYDNAGIFGFVGVVARYYIEGGAANQNNGSNTICSATAIVATTTYHLVGVYNAPAGTLDLYLNGKSDQVQKTGEATSIAAATANLRIGAREYASYEGYLDGQVSEVAIWTRPLRSGEIQHLYSLGPGGIFTPRRRRVVSAQEAAAPATAFYVVGGGCASASGVI